MAVYGYKYTPLRNRVPIWMDRRYEIQGYGQDNLYPQRAKDTRDNSPTAKTACARYAEFINGEGFTDPMFGSMVVNRRGHTANDLLDKVAENMSWANGFFIHVGYNLNYKVSSAKVVNFEYNRFGLPDINGEFFDIKYSTNWENNPYKNINGQMDICPYPVFNPDPYVIKEQINEAGGIMNYKGQIFYWVPEEDQYPKSTFDVVFDQAQTEGEIGVLDLAMEQNGFLAKHALSYPGKFESPKAYQDFVDKINGFTGEGAGGMIIFENPDGILKVDEMLTTLQMPQTDELHVNVDKRVRGAIRRVFGMPVEVLADTPETGIFDSNKIQDAYTFYNSVTSNSRKIVSRQMKRIFDNWHTPTSGKYDIIPQKYTNTMTPA